MRIAFSGSAGQGKTTVVGDFLKEWPQYRRSAESHRQLVKEKVIPVNKNVTAEGQWDILQCLVKDVEGLRSSDNMVFDRCALDNIVYSLWAAGTGSSNIDKEFIGKCAEVVKEYMRKIDIIFFLPITRVAPVKLVEREGRDTDPMYVAEIDNIFKALAKSHNEGKCPFFVHEDSPPIIEIYGSPAERIQMIKLYVDTKGASVETTSSILSLDNIQMMERLVMEQAEAKEVEDRANPKLVIKNASKLLP